MGVGLSNMFIKTTNWFSKQFLKIGWQRHKIYYFLQMSRGEIFLNSSSHSALNSSLTLVVIDFVRFCFILRIQWLSLRLLYSLWIDQFYRRAKKFKAVFFSCVSQLSRYVILSYSAAYMTHHYHHDKHMLPTIFSKKSYSMMQVFLSKK